MSYTDVMIDIETFDTTLDSVIVAISAVKFNLEGDSSLEIFYQNIGPISCQKLGMTISQETVDWWKQRPKEVRDAIMRDQVPIHDGLTKLRQFLSDCTKETNFWANRIVFDYGNLENAFRRTGIACPWKYYQVYDVATVCKVACHDQRTTVRVGDYHNAKDDCLTQIKQMREALEC